MPFTAAFGIFMGSTHVRPKSVAVELDRVSCSLGWMGPARPSLRLAGGGVETVWKEGGGGVEGGQRPRQGGVETVWKEEVEVEEE